MRRLILLFVFISASTSAQKIGGQVISAPMLPQTVPSVAYPSESSYTITPVASGANLQTALTGAACGTILSLAHGGSWSTGASYSLPNTACTCHTDSTKWVIIRSDAYVGGSTRGSVANNWARIDPSVEYVNLAHITSTDTTTFAVTNNGTGCYWFGPGLDVGNTNANGFAVIDIGNGTFSVANFPHDFVIDHSYVHGISTASITHGAEWGGNSLSAVDSYISDIHAVGFDSQAINVRDGVGPYLIQNNFLAGAAENTIFGGAPSNALMCDDTQIHNHHFKPMAWSQVDPSYAGFHWTVKNLIEFKNVCRALVTGNIFENTWTDGQNEAEILNTNCSGSAPALNGIQDVTETYNIFKNIPNWFVYGGCNTAVVQPTSRVLLRDNLIYNSDACVPGGCRETYDVVINPGAAPGAPFNAFDLWMFHNTVSADKFSGAVNLTNGNPNNFYYGIKFYDNVVGEPGPSAFASFNWQTRLNAQGTAEGDPTYTAFTPGGNFKNNCYFGPSGGTYTNAGFSGTQLPANAAAVFVNPGVDFHVAASSVCHSAASDGTDMGANIDAVNAATSGVVQPLANLHTVTNVSPSTFTHNGSTSITITGTNFLSGVAQVSIGGAGPTSAISTIACAVNTCTVVMSAAITLAVNDLVNVVGEAPTSPTIGPAWLGTFPSVASVTDTTHFTYTYTGIGTQSWTGGTANRVSPGNACTSVVVVNSTTITCVTPAATGTVTNGTVPIFVSQWGIPVQSAVYGLYN